MEQCLQWDEITFTLFVLGTVFSAGAYWVMRWRYSTCSDCWVLGLLNMLHPAGPFATDCTVHFTGFPGLTMFWLVSESVVLPYASSKCSWQLLRLFPQWITGLEMKELHRPGLLSQYVLHCKFALSFFKRCRRRTRAPHHHCYLCFVPLPYSFHDENPHELPCASGDKVFRVA